MFILIRKANRLLMERMGIFLCIMEGIKGPALLPTSLPSFLPFKPRWLPTAEPVLPLQPLPLRLHSAALSRLGSLALSPHFLCCSLCVDFVFCLRKPRDIHGTEANNVELKTKFLRPYPSNKTITICSEDKPAIICRILYTTPSPVRGKHCPFPGLSLCDERERPVPLGSCKIRESKYNWSHLQKI